MDENKLLKILIIVFLVLFATKVIYDKFSSNLELAPSLPVDYPLCNCRVEQAAFDENGRLGTSPQIKVNCPMIYLCEPHSTCMVEYTRIDGTTFVTYSPCTR